MDSIRVNPPVRNYTLGRMPDGSSAWDTLSPTPGTKNSSPVPGRAYAAPVTDLTAGRYEDPIEVSLSKSVVSGNIHYTLDGNDPTAQSPVYTGPISIKTTSTLKARTIGDSLLPGNIRICTYFIGEHPFTLPVVSLSIPPEYLIDPSIGIYVVGENGIERCNEVANYNRDWERPVNMEYFTSDGMRKFNRNAGVQISGNCSRNWEQKSLAIFFRDKYGKSKINYPLFADKPVDRFKALVLRNSGNDFNDTHFRDGLMHSLVIGNMNVDALGYSPAAAYINGTYWGVLNIREKPNEDYLYTNYGLDEDSIDLLEKNGLIVQGDNKEYLELVEYLSLHDLSAESTYEYVKSRIDIDSYINYQLTELFYGNIDWPGNNNRFWKSRKPGSKWRWILFDLDLGFGLYTPATINTLVYATADNSTEYNNPPWATLLFRKLLENDEFTNQFVDRSMVYMGSLFRPERNLYFIDSIQSIIRDEMYHHNLRWNLSDEVWNKNVEELRAFGRVRSDIMTEHMADFFKLRDPVALEVRTNYRKKGLITMNQVNLPDSVFKGNCYAYRPVEITANDHIELVFDHWEIQRQAGSDSASLQIDTAKTLHLVIWDETKLTAIYKTRDVETGIVINEFCTSNSFVADEYGEFDDWIEIYNMSDRSINLSGFYLTDDLSQPGKWVIPPYGASISTIDPKGYLVFWADGQSGQGPLHTSFKLSREGGQIGVSQLYNGEYVLLDNVTYVAQDDNYSFGRYKDGSEKWFTFSILTPGVANELELPTSIALEHETDGLTVFPNPVHDMFTLLLPKTETDWIITLTDMFGRKVRTWKSGSDSISEDISSLPDGVYQVNARCGSKDFKLRIVKLK
jgi:hypothetical protein